MKGNKNRQGGAKTRVRRAGGEVVAVGRRRRVCHRWLQRQRLRLWRRRRLRRRHWRRRRDVASTADAVATAVPPPQKYNSGGESDAFTTRKNHFIPCDEQTKSGNFTTKIRKFFRFHCVRAASNPFRLVLDTVTPLTAVHGSPRPLYPSSFKCARACTPEQSRYLPGGPGCAHGPKSCPTGVQL